MRIYEKIRDALFGMAIGDALGVPFEFEERGSFVATGYHVDANLGGIPARSRWKGVVPWGAWSDDTSMALAMMDAIIDEEGITSHGPHSIVYVNIWGSEHTSIRNQTVRMLGPQGRCLLSECLFRNCDEIDFSCQCLLLSGWQSLCMPFYNP